MNWFRKNARSLLGLLLLGLLVIYISRVDFQQVFINILLVRWWMLGVLSTTLIAYLCATRAWQLCFDLPEYLKPSFFRLFIIRQLGETLTLVNPTNIIAGELSKIYMLTSNGVNKHIGGLSIILSRGLIILSYFLLLIIAGSYYSFQIIGPVLKGWVILVIVLAVLIFTITFYVLTSDRLIVFTSIRKVLESFSVSSKFRQSLRHIRALNINMSTFYKERRLAFLSAFGFSILHWVVGTFEFYFILNALDFHITFLDAMMMEMGVMVFKSAGGFIPGQIGVEEYGNKIMLGMLGIPEMEIWVAVSILRRARQLFWVALSLFFLILFYKPKDWKYSL